MIFKLRINNGMSKGAYQSSKTQKLHEVGQGARNGGKLIFISIPVIDTIEEVAPDCIIYLPQTQEN